MIFRRPDVFKDLIPLRLNLKLLGHGTLQSLVIIAHLSSRHLCFADALTRRQLAVHLPEHHHALVIFKQLRIDIHCRLLRIQVLACEGLRRVERWIVINGIVLSNLRSGVIIGDFVNGVFVSFIGLLSDLLQLRHVKLWGLHFVGSWHLHRVIELLLICDFISDVLLILRNRSLKAWKALY